MFVGGLLNSPQISGLNTGRIDDGNHQAIGWQEQKEFTVER